MVVPNGVPCFSKIESAPIKRNTAPHNGVDLMQAIFINPSEILEAIKPVLGKKRCSHKKPFVVTMEANEGMFLFADAKYGAITAGVPCKGKWASGSVEINGPYFRDILKTYSNEELIQIGREDFYIEINCGGSTTKINRLDPDDKGKVKKEALPHHGKVEHPPEPKHKRAEFFDTWGFSARVPMPESACKNRVK